MNTFFIYLWLQFKKMFQLMPKLILATIVLAILAGTIAFYGTKLLYQDSAADKVTIALVIEDETPLMDLGLQYLQSSESVNTFCELLSTDLKTARRLVEEKKAAAFIHFPKGFTDDIVSGENTPATVTFSGEPGIEQLLFKELANTASRILSYAQADIYTIHDLYEKYKFKEKRGRHYDFINENTMYTAFIRGQLFEVKQISSTGALSTKDFYFSSGLVLLVLLPGMSLGGFARLEKESFGILLSRKKLYAPLRLLAKLFVLLFFYLLVWCTLLWLCLGTQMFFYQCIPVVLVLALFCACWTLFCYQLTRHEMSGTLLLFFSAIVSTFCSGCLIPSAFLPQAIRLAGTAFPAHFLHRLFGTLLTDTGLARKELFSLLLFSAGFLLIGLVLVTRRERRACK